MLARESLGHRFGAATLQEPTSSSGQDVALWPRQPRFDSWRGRYSISNLPFAGTPTQNERSRPGLSHGLSVDRSSKANAKNLRPGLAHARGTPANAGSHEKANVAVGGAPVVTETVMDGASSVAEAVMGKGNREPYGFRVEIM